MLWKRIALYLVVQTNRQSIYNFSYSSLYVYDGYTTHHEFNLFLLLPFFENSENLGTRKDLPLWYVHLFFSFVEWTRYAHQRRMFRKNWTKIISSIPPASLICPWVRFCDSLPLLCLCLLVNLLEDIAIN